MNIGIIGVGGVGGYFGGKLTKLLNENLNVYFVDRNKHLDEIKKNGLILTTQDEGELLCTPTFATDNIEDLPPLDLCIICVKSYDLNNVLKSLKSKIKNNTAIIPLLNGVDIYERIRKIIPSSIIYPACAYLGTHVEAPGKVTQNGGSCTIFLGNSPKDNYIYPKNILDLFDACGIKYKWCSNPNIEIWSKFIFIASYGMVTASEDKTLGEVLDSKSLSETVIGIMKEIETLAAKLGINLPKNIVEDSFKKAYGFPYEIKTSFQRDFEKKDNLHEGELFGDTIIRLGYKTIETPITNAVNMKLKTV